MPPQTYIDAETRLHDVRVYVDGLHGETHAAAVAAAERLRNLAGKLVIIGQRFCKTAVFLAMGIQITNEWDHYEIMI